VASVSTMDRAKGLAAGLMAGVFCACAATLLSSLWIVLFWAAPAHAFHRWYELPMGIFVISLTTCVPAGAFGFVCGVLGRLYLVLRSPHITSTVRLLAESAVTGTLLSAFFPLFLLLMRWGPTEDWLKWKGMLFSIAVGCPVSILYAAFFHKSLLGSNSAPEAQLT
jgi:hypothetical protein